MRSNDDVAWAFCLLCIWLLVSEILSVMPAEGLACVVNENHYADYYSGKSQCPSFHVFIFDALYRVFALLGDDKWLNAISALITAIFTAVLAGVSIFQGRMLMRADVTARAAADAAKETAATTREALIASNRAWIRPHVSFGSSLTIDENGISGAISIELENSGNSPANHVNIQAWMAPWSQARQPKFLLQERSAATARPVTGFTLFPGERFPRDKGLGGWKIGVAVTHADCEVAASDVVNPQKIVPLYVYGCITYTFSSDPVGRHQTRFIYEVGKNPTVEPRRPYITMADGQIEETDLYLLEPSMGFGQEAD